MSRDKFDINNVYGIIDVAPRDNETEHPCSFDFVSVRKTILSKMFCSPCVTNMILNTSRYFSRTAVIPSNSNAVLQ